MDIVEELRQNREAGARRLESEYKVGLVSFARRLCADPSDAEELVNRTFAAVIEGIDDYLEQSAFFGWMCKIMMNINAADHRRRADRDVVYPGDLPDVADDDALESIARNVDASLLRDAIETLPAEMKEAIVMHYLMEQPVVRVAKFLALPVSTVKWRLHCAREILAAKLGAAAKKPGGKALLAVIALCAFAAAGAAGFAAIRTMRNAECRMQNVECTMHNAQCTMDGAAGEQPPNRQTVNPTIQQRADESTAQPSNSQTVKQSNQQEQEEPTMNKRSLIAASAAAVLAAGAPVSSSASPLPAGYTQHTYIKGNATVSGGSTTSENAGYILTDIYPDPAQDTIDAVMSIGEGLTTKELWCARTTANVATLSLLYNGSTKKIRFDYYNAYSKNSANTYLPGDTLYIHVEGGKCSLTKALGANEKLSYTDQTSFHATGGPLLFSAMSSISGSGYGALAEGYYNNGELYSFTITRNGTVLHDLVPCVRDSDGQPGLYDIAPGGKFHPGTGSFTMGAAVPPRGHRVQYVEATGEQYVDTLWTPTKDFRAVVDLSFTVTDKGGGGFGYAAAGSVQSFRFWRVLADGAATYKVNINDSSTVVNDLPTTLDTARHVIDISNTAKYIDGVPFGDTSGLSATLASSFYLFALHFGWDPYVNYGSYRIYSCKLYEGATLVRNLVPYTDANGKACLYDVLNKKAYYNAASGADLVAGPLLDRATRLMLR